MPTVDRKPRRRIAGARPDFASEPEALSAADAVRALPTGQREDAWRALLPRLRRWIEATWKLPSNTADWLDAAARAYYLSGRFRVQRPPQGR
jgi:hypothetical protein